MVKTFILSEIPQIASNLLNLINNKNNNDNAKIITLSGDLGVGKTTLTKELAKLLGVKEDIVSPTFVIMKKYKINNGKFKNLIHIDAYRLNNAEELFSLGWREISENKNNLIIIEWPEMVADCLNSGICRVVLDHKDEKTRVIEILL